MFALRHLGDYRRNRSVRRAANFILIVAIILPSIPVTPKIMIKVESKTVVHKTQGPPGWNLPNLDSTSRLTPGIPKIISQVPLSKDLTTTDNRIANMISGLFSSVGTGSFAASALRNNYVAMEKTSEHKTVNNITSIPFRSKGAETAASTLQDDNWPMALLDQKNRIGGGGEDLLSRNFNWGLPLVGLPGRAGMDLNLGLSLNSLIWTKSGSNIHFNLSDGFPSTGFQLGFPELKSYFYNSETGTISRLVTMPSGQVLEFWKNPALGDDVFEVYEERSGSNMIIVEEPGFFDPSETTWKLLLPDGTTYKYIVVGNNPKCVEIKDRNGNYISVTYTAFERINTITDTLGRVVNFNYDQSNRLSSITQNWSGQTHVWATFAYQNLTLETYFLSLDMVGGQNGQTISVLSQVGLSDGSVFAFEYSPYAQVHTIRRYAPNSLNPSTFPGDYTQLSYVTYDLLGTSVGEQNDSPRFNSRRDWAKDWNDGVITTFDGDRNSWGTVTSPNGVIYKELFGTSGWQRGLTLNTETWYNGAKKKWTDASWVNGNANASYLINPRVVETNVYDEQGNRKRATMDYTDYGSVSDIREYGSPNINEVQRHSHIEYWRGSAYIDNRNRRMTGLVKSQALYNGSEALFSKVTYEYDLGEEYLVQQGLPILHDSIQYGASFNQGRGNVNVVRRWDVTDPNNLSKTLISLTGYNTSGSVIFTKDGLGHQTTFKYTDSFSDSQNRNTFAYVTEAMDADGFSSTVKYNFDLGVITRTQNPKGAATVNTFDSIGRLERVTNQVNSAYTRYVYAPNQTYLQTYTTINDLNSEFYSIKIVDGYGRLRAVASEHPNSIGGMRAQYFDFDNMGRQVRQTNPTEIDANWNPVGDDATGYAWRHQQYDWMGRTVTSTNQDGTRKTVSYGACGCSGTNTITNTDEMGRRQKDFYDSFGHLAKSQILNFDGSVYSTTTNTYNILGQVLRTNLQESENGEGQEALMTYDGYGRLRTSKKPIESSPTIYAYNNDDTMHTVTDPRGVIATFSYNNRKLPTSISYNEVVDVITTGTVTFGYDNLGNKIWMDDTPGRIDYSINDVNQLVSETRQIDGLGTYAISYTYNLGGQLKSVTNPSGNTFSYDFDEAGRIVSVNGSGTNVASQYATNIRYRAWNAVKHIDYSNSVTLNKTYNARLSPIRYELNNISDRAYNPIKIMGYNFDYYSDGRLRFAHDLNNNQFDRNYSYDNAGRISESLSGKEARDEPIIIDFQRNDRLYIPYKQTIGYDVFGNITSHHGYEWRRPTTDNNTFSKQTNRRPNWVYDNSGNVIKNPETYNTSIFDSSSRSVKFLHGLKVKGGQSSVELETVYDGNGAPLKKVDIRREDEYEGDEWQRTITITQKGYFIRSSVLEGAVIAEITEDMLGVKNDGNIYVNGERIARQHSTGNPTWYFYPHGTGSWISSGKLDGAQIGHREEMNALGGNVGTVDPTLNNPSVRKVFAEFTPTFKGYDHGARPEGCVLDGMPTDCDIVQTLLRGNGIAAYIITDRGERLPADVIDMGGGRIAVTEIGHSITSSGEIDVPDTVNEDGDIVITTTEVKAQTTTFTPQVHFINLVQGETRATTNEERQRLLNDAYITARQALKDQCGHLFRSDIDPVALLDSFYNGTKNNSIKLADLGGISSGRITAAATKGVLGGILKITHGTEGPSVTRISKFTGATITINTNSDATFFGSYRGYLGINNDAISRAITLIHELGHAANLMYGSKASFISDDDTGTTPEVASTNRLNSWVVYSTCFRQVPQLMR